MPSDAATGSADAASGTNDSATADSAAATPRNGGAGKTSASGVGQAPPPPQQPSSPGVTRAGVPSLNFIKVRGAAPGGTASVSVQTTSGASCTLAYRTPSGNTSSATGLGQKTADANGVTVWSWLIDSNTTAGLGRLSANRGNLGISDIIQIGSVDPSKR